MPYLRFHWAAWLWICSCHAWATAVQLAAHIRTGAALGLQRTPIKMKVQSSAARIRSRLFPNTRLVPGLVWSCLVWVFDYRLGIWPTTSCAFCINSKACMCSFLRLMLAKGENKEKSGEAEERKQNQRLQAASISIAWLCLLKECVFVLNRADRGVYTSSFYSNIGSFLVSDCCDVTVPELLISQNTINLRNEECFPFLIPRLKGGVGGGGGNH